MTTDFTNFSLNENLRTEILDIAAKHRRNRIVRSKIFLALSGICFALALTPLFALSWIIVQKGLPVLKLSFFTQMPLQPNLMAPNQVGGVSGAIIGSLVLVAYASIFSLPIGILVGIYVAENENKFAAVMRLISQTMAGAPSILMGLFAFTLICQRLQFGYSAVAGAFALGVLMLPVIVVATEIAVRNVPQTLREAGLALGARSHKVSLRIVLPSAAPGILTGAVLAMSRAIGEAAPVLFTIGGSSFLTWKPGDQVNALPIAIFNNSRSQWPSQRQEVFGIALVLLIFVFSANFISKIVMSRQQKKTR
ncbi:MAG: phosphate ABC transporter permease PstA [Actinomycetota bacterium]